MDMPKSLNPMFSSMLISACSDVIVAQGQLTSLGGDRRAEVTAAIANLQSIVDLVLALKNASIIDVDQESISLLLYQIEECGKAA